MNARLPGDKSRFQFALPIADEHRYESSAHEWNVDFAFRWARTFEDWDLGLSYFTGNSRDPQFLPVFSGGQLKLQPFYDRIQQISSDIQWTYGAWLWKYEALFRSSEAEDYYAHVGGF